MPNGRQFVPALNTPSTEMPIISTLAVAEVLLPKPNWILRFGTLSGCHKTKSQVHSAATRPHAATMTASTSPCCASCPASTRTAATLPAIGAVTATSI